MKDFDAYIQEQLKNHRAQVPDDMFARIQASQAPEDVKKPLFFYWKIILALGFFFGLCLFTYSILPNEKFNESMYSESATLLTDNNSTDTKDYNFKHLLQANLQTSGTAAVAESKSINSAISEKKDLRIANQAIQNNERKAMHSTTALLSIAEEKLQTEKNIIPIASPMNLPVNTQEKPADIQRDVFNTNRITSLVHYGNYTTDNKLVLNGLDLPDYENKCPKFGHSYHGYFSVEAYHAANKNIRNLHAKTPAWKSHVAMRDSTESARYSYSNGVLFRWHNSAGLSLGAGIEHNRINEIFQYVEPNSRQVKTVISTDTIFLGDGTYTTSTDTTRIELMGTKSNRILNHYQSFEIPIRIAFQREFGRFGIGIQAGVNFNVLGTNRGRILDQSQKPKWISSSGKNEWDSYANNSIIKFDAAIHIVYHLSPTLDILAAPYFRYSKHTLTKESYPVHHSYHTMGIRAGLRYNFGF